MVTDDHAKSARQGRALRLTVLALTTLAVVVGTAFLMGSWPRAPQAETAPPGTPSAGGQGEPGAADPARLFRGWPRPDLALILSGEQHGYLQPCGCSRPQFGGLARRFNFLQTLKERGWPM